MVIKSRKSHLKSTFDDGIVVHWSRRSTSV
jgi:hypothetical protein